MTVPMDPALIAELAAVAADLARASSRLAALAKKISESKPPETTRGLVWDGPPEYVDTKQAAKLLGVSRAGLEGLRARGLGPKYVRIGSKVRYRLCDLPVPK